ncbi:MAG: hypothetical protein AB1705_12835 [Verrucomicrobiota bacterium]
MKPFADLLKSLPLPVSGWMISGMMFPEAASQLLADQIYPSAISTYGKLLNNQWMPVRIVGKPIFATLELWPLIVLMVRPWNRVSPDLRVLSVMHGLLFPLFAWPVMVACVELTD